MGAGVGESPPSDQASLVLSVLIPVHNEASMLVASVDDLRHRLVDLDCTFEIVLAENGSSDRTLELAENLAQRHQVVRVFSYPQPNYGGALREAIHRARGEFVICEEIDLCDVDFHRRALEILRADGADMVVGSKAMQGARDRRPPFRRLATRVYNRVLRTALGFRGTDTHGLKAFRRSRVTDVAAQCVVEHDVFASELVIRAQRARLRVVEIPVDTEEKRAPSIHLIRRVPKVLRNLARLWLAVHGPEREGYRLDPSGDDGG